MSYTISAVDRALALLEVLAENADIGVTELAERTGNTKSLVFRLLFTLEQRGYVQKDPVTRTYALGYRSLFLADHVRQQSRLIVAAQPYLDTLVEQTHENVVLAVREDLHSVCIAMRESPQPLRLSGQRGQRFPLHAGGGPKVLLAFAPENLANRSGPVPAFANWPTQSGATKTTPDIVHLAENNSTSRVEVRNNTGWSLGDTITFKFEAKIVAGGDPDYMIRATIDALGDSTTNSGNTVLSTTDWTEVSVTATIGAGVRKRTRWMSNPASATTPPEYWNGPGT